MRHIDFVEWKGRYNPHMLRDAVPMKAGKVQRGYAKIMKDLGGSLTESSGCMVPNGDLEIMAGVSVVGLREGRRVERNVTDVFTVSALLVADQSLHDRILMCIRNDMACHIASLLVKGLDEEE